MAVPRSVAVVLVLLVAVSAIPAGLAHYPPASESLTKACSKTVEPETCTNLLKSHPESATASPKRLAELAFGYLIKEGPLLATETKAALLALPGKDEATKACITKLDEKLNAGVACVVKLPAPEQGEAQFNAAKAKLTELLSLPSDTKAACPESVAKAEPIVLKIHKYQKIQEVTLDLMKAAYEEKKPAVQKA